jgi:hypothetical protein
MHTEALNMSVAQAQGGSGPHAAADAARVAAALRRRADANPTAAAASGKHVQLLCCTAVR